MAESTASISERSSLTQHEKEQRHLAAHINDTGGFLEDVRILFLKTII